MAKHKSERLARLQAQKASVKKPKNLYLDDALFLEFKKVIDPLTVSEVFEDYMRDEIAISKGELEIQRNEKKKK